MEEMKRGIALGGEQSGHIIFSDHLFTGDGIATGLDVLRVMADTGRELADLASELVTYPQVLVNVRVRERKDLSTVPAVARCYEARRGAAGRDGRLLVRYPARSRCCGSCSRKDQQEIQNWAAEIAGVVKVTLSGSLDSGLGAGGSGLWFGSWGGRMRRSRFAVRRLRHAPGLPPSHSSHSRLPSASTSRC